MRKRILKGKSALTHVNGSRQLARSLKKIPKLAIKHRKLIKSASKIILPIAKELITSALKK